MTRSPQGPNPFGPKRAPSPALRAAVALYAVAGLQAVMQTTTGFMIPLYVSDRIGAPSHLAQNLVLFSLPSAGGFVIAHLVGGLIDQTGRIKPYMLAALGANATGFALLLWTREPWAILLSTAIAASVNVTLNTAQKTYVTRLSEAAKGRGVARLLTAAQVGWLLGSVLLVVYFRDAAPESAQAIVAADLCLAVATLAIVAVLLPPVAEAAGGVGVGVVGSAVGHGVWTGIRDELRALYAEPRLVRACVGTMFLVAGNWVFVSTFSLFVAEHLGAPRQVIGWLNGIATTVAIALLPFLGRLHDRFGAAASLRVAAAGYLGAYAVLFAYPSVGTAGFVFSVPAYASLIIGLVGASADIAGIERRGGGIGIVDGLWAVATAVGAAIGGFLADQDLGHVPPVALMIVAVGTALTLFGARGPPNWSRPG